MSIWWQRPRIRTDEEEHRERKVTWLELFYDLVFVVVVAELSHNLAGDVTPEGIAGFVLLFIPVWWVWIGGTFYNERFETEDLSNRVFFFLQMLPVAALAVFAHHALGESSTGFALSYVAARLLIIFLWLRGGHYEPLMRPVTNRYAAGFSLSVLLFTASVFVAPPVRFVLWGVGLFIDLVTPLTTLEIQRRLPRFSTSKLPERFGLFTIIVLGESIVGVVGGLAEREVLTSSTWITGGLGMVLAFALWWIYFDFVARRLPRLGVWWQLSWGYLHLPLVMSIAATGAGVLNLVAHEGGLPSPIRILLAGATGAALISVALLEITLRGPHGDATRVWTGVWIKLAGAALALAVGGLGEGWGPVPVLLILISALILQIGYGAANWERLAAES